MSLVISSYKNPFYLFPLTGGFIRNCDYFRSFFGLLIAVNDLLLDGYQLCWACNFFYFKTIYR